MSSAAPQPGTALRPRVLLVCGRLDPERDGVGDYVVRLAGALRAEGARVRILHLGAAAGARGSRSVGTRWGPAGLLRAARAARGADVVHVQFAPSMYGFRLGVGLLPLLLRRVALVTTVHEYGSWRWERLLPAPLWRAMERRGVADRETALLVPRSDAVVATNLAHSTAVRHRFSGRVPDETIPIGANVAVAADVEAASTRDEVRAGLGLPPEAVVAAFFGFVHPVKGVRYLADAVARLVGEGRDVHALVVGGFESLALPREEAADFETELRGHLAEAGVTDRVHVTGFRDADAVSRLLAAADLGVLPFTHGVTAKSGSLLTLLAHGLPTVVTSGESTEPELVDGDRVVVVPQVRDGVALADGLRRLLDDPALAARIADQGRRWTATRSWQAIAARHLDVYRDAART
ncbi:glycosyltransferase family 4 protein [uncultured Amnibacterium sp.]|uniref:glycosyltransferase family 4 protein n=1 Tax=uncultured Amnibacterium sp. TaxID=1631851 RepID=UPI0035CC6461